MKAHAWRQQVRLGTVLLGIACGIYGCRSGGDEVGRADSTGSPDRAAARAVAVNDTKGQMPGREGAPGKGCTFVDQGIPQGIPDRPDAASAAARKRLRDHAHNLCYKAVGTAGTHTDTIVCKDCQNPIEVVILPAPGVRNLDIRHLFGHGGQPQNGRIVALIHNNGPGEYTELQLQQGEEAFWWVGKGSGNDTISIFFKTSSTDVDTVYQTNFRSRPVPPSQQQHAYSAAHWGDPHGPEHLAAEADTTGTFTSHNSTWINCAGGCCRASNMFTAKAR
jgi:hypothetical protein